MDPKIDHVIDTSGYKVYKNSVLIGFVTDFGREGLTKNMKWNELVSFVKEKARNFLGKFQINFFSHRRIHFGVTIKN
jgi:hypothetical protein